MAKLGLFNWVDGIAGTGELIAQDSSLSGTGAVIGPCGPQSGDFEAAVAASWTTGTIAGGTFGQKLVCNRTLPAPDLVTVGYEPAGVLSFYDACVSWDFLGCAFDNGSGDPDDKIMYWPSSATDATDAELVFVFNFGTTVLAQITGWIGGAFGDTGTSTEGETATTYWQDQGITASDPAYYNK